MLGRDPSLTDRTAVWADVLALQNRPMLGYGFESFWLGDRLMVLWNKWWWRPTQAHNGYIETYLNLGLVGLGLLAGLLLSTFRVSVGSLLNDFASRGCGWRCCSRFCCSLQRSRLQGGAFIWTFLRHRDGTAETQAAWRIAALPSRRTSDDDGAVHPSREGSHASWPRRRPGCRSYCVAPAPLRQVRYVLDSLFMAADIPWSMSRCLQHQGPGASAGRREAARPAAAHCSSRMMRRPEHFAGSSEVRVATRLAICSLYSVGPGSWGDKRRRRLRPRRQRHLLPELVGGTSGQRHVNLATVACNQRVPPARGAAGHRRSLPEPPARCAARALRVHRRPPVACARMAGRTQLCDGAFARRRFPARRPGTT